VQFPNFTSEQWYSAAQRTWKPQAGKLVLTYDPALAESLAEFDSVDFGLKVRCQLSLRMPLIGEPDNHPDRPPHRKTPAG
jgi:hypothetical protein